METRELQIKPLFANALPPLTEDEFKQLEENILADGKVIFPLMTWHGFIADGHNRWKIIQKHPEIEYSTSELEAENEYAVLEWIYRTQIGKRNMTREQRNYAIGKMNEARKKSVGGNGENQYTVQLAQNGPIAKKQKSTAETIAKEIGVGTSTVKRAAQFAKGVDAIREVNPDAANKVLSGKSGVTNKLIQNVPNMEPDEVHEVVQDILDDTVREKASDQNKYYGNTAKGRAMRETIKQAYEPMRDYNADSTYNLDDMIEEITVNGERYIAQLHRTIEIHNEIMRQTDEGLTAVQNAINKILRGIREELPRYEEQR